MRHLRAPATIPLIVRRVEPMLVREVEREVYEGEGHTGLASVVQFIARKSA
jgi:hypothetical protein